MNYATPEAHGKPQLDDVAVVISFQNASNKTYNYFANSGLGIKVGDTVVVNTASMAGAAWKYVEVIDVIHDISLASIAYKRIVRVYKPPEARKQTDDEDIAARGCKLHVEMTALFEQADKQYSEQGPTTAIRGSHRRIGMPPELGMGYSLSEETYKKAAEKTRIAALNNYDGFFTCVLNNASTQPNLPKEKIMIKIEKLTFINNTNAATLSDDTLFELVISTEADIKHLDDIQNKSEKVQLKIEQLRKSIRELNAYIDSRP